jgi:beta-glucosidase/6-phospho-beta-glucosidase/beta-galactosidase
MITIYHWDLPQWLQDIGGWTNPEIIKYYVFYADLLFKTYGDKVKTWITFNEPGVFCDLGYSYGSHAPHIATYKNIGGHLCSHHVLLAHAETYHMYREKYHSQQKGQVAININCSFMFGKNENVTQETTDKAIEFMVSDFQAGFDTN